MPRSRALPLLPVLLALLVPAASAAPAESWTLFNPTGHHYTNELLRLPLAIPEDASRATWGVFEDGGPVPFQLEGVEGRLSVWVAASLEPGETHRYTAGAKPAPAVEPAVRVTQADGFTTLDNGVIAVRVPAEQRGTPAPIAAVRLPDGRWVGEGQWETGRRLTAFSSTVVGDGTVFGKVRLRYHFDGPAGLDGDVSAQATVAVSLAPGHRHVTIEESHTMGREDAWVFDCAAGWAPDRAVVVPHHGGFGRPTLHRPDGEPFAWPPELLVPGQTRMGDTLLNLSPRWSQAYDDGWLFVAHNGELGLGAAVCRAGRWFWPQNNWLQAKVRESGDYAGLRCPTWRGSRYWYLVSGPAQAWREEPAERYLIRHSLESLDKLFSEYILTWPGLEPPAGSDVDPATYADPAGRCARRSTAFFRWGSGRGWADQAAHPITTLTRAQVMFDPDTYGSYWLGWSPENPNFATTWWRPGFWLVEKLKGHPQFPALARMAEQKMREDMYHSITLPGGAGQECFGYMTVGMHDRERLADMCRDTLGFNLRAWPRYRAGASFLMHTSFPYGDGMRRAHPGGDTHPPGPDVIDLALERGVNTNLAGLTTEELPGYGVVFHNRVGEPLETYLGFKSGPNRGHFHGDQLSFHYAPNGRPQVVDHHCSYGPRAGQEHMHNRVAFHTAELPWANMDGYERLIAFKTADTVDIAMGQVESERLRETTPFPPENWDTYLPQHVFDTPLRYRRTIVMLRGGAQDYFVIRDQHDGPAVHATYCLHAYGERMDVSERRVVDFDGVQLFVAAPAEYTVDQHDWQHSNGGPEATRGLRLTTQGAASEFVTVLYPKPLRPCDRMELTLKGAVQRKVPENPRNRRSRKVMRALDVHIDLPWVDGAPRTDLADVSCPEWDRKVDLRAELEAEGTPDAATLRLAFEFKGRHGKPGPTGRLDVRIAREAEALDGAFSGTFEDAVREGTVQGRRHAATYARLPVYAPFEPPVFEAVPGGVRVGNDTIVFGGGIDEEADTVYVRVRRGEGEAVTLTGAEVDLARSQGEIGLFVPDAGYPFGVIPDWLIRQRRVVPDWYEDAWPPRSAP